MKYRVFYETSYDIDDYGSLKWNDRFDDFNSLEEAIVFCSSLLARELSKDKDDRLFNVTINSIRPIESNLLTEELLKEIETKAKEKAEIILRERKQEEELKQIEEAAKLKEKKLAEFYKLK